MKKKVESNATTQVPRIHTLKNGWVRVKRALNVPFRWHMDMPSVYGVGIVYEVADGVTTVLPGTPVLVHTGRGIPLPGQEIDLLVPVEDVIATMTTEPE